MYIYISRVKELKFDRTEKNKNISRDNMKEMKLMREVRHPNINSFIGKKLKNHDFKNTFLKAKNI